jgi:hypothetical protein
MPMLSLGDLFVSAQKQKKKTLRYDQKYFFNGYTGINIKINI